MAIQLGSAYGKVSIDSSGVKKGVDDGIKSLKKLEDAGSLIGGALQTVGAGLTLGVTVPVVAFFKSSIDAAMDAESALTELNAVIKSTGGIAGVTADEVTKMASELQKVTKFEDDQIVLGQSMLLTFTKIGKEIFPLATEAMLNMAEKFGSVDQAAIQLGKALNDPVAGVGALRRVGVALTEQQEEMIKKFVEMGDIASAQKVILDELEVEFGGLARAAGDTTAGKISQLNNAFDDLKETVGAQLIPLIVPLVTGLTSLVEKFSNLHPFVQKLIIIFLAFAALVGPILLFVGSVLSAISTIAGFVSALGGLGISVAGVGTALAGVGTTISAVFLPVLAALGAALLPIVVVLASIVLFAGIFALAWKSNFLYVRDAANAVFTFIKNAWKDLT
ncbi:MAG TPA: phage tail length tape measure family protein, partial [Anaerolineales bacterium]|nr:phage tail length tape measure family protein [Anaerolineales bacterium]